MAVKARFKLGDQVRVLPHTDWPAKSVEGKYFIITRADKAEYILAASDSESMGWFRDSELELVYRPEYK